VKLPQLAPSAYARVTLLAAVAVGVIIVTGGAVRVTGSGLGCTDWPNCTPDHFVAEWNLHQQIEYINRLFTGVVSVAVILAVLGSLRRTPRRRDLTWLSLSLVFGVLLQAVLGGLSVLNKLRPEWVMAHFLVSMLLLWAALVLHYRAREADARPHLAVHRQFLVLGRLIGVLAFAVLFVGTLVTGSGPHGGDENVVRLGFDPHTVTKVHGSLVWCLIALVVFTAWRLHAVHASATLVKRAEILVAALLGQGAIGYLQYSLNVPAGLVLVHIAGATLVWTAVVWFNLGFYERFGDVGIGVYDGEQFPQSFPASMQS
jgi:heme a synthase